MLSRTEVANKPFLQLILILSLFIAFFVISLIIVVVVIAAFYNLDVESLKLMVSDLSKAGKEAASAMKISQLINAGFIFILAPLLFAFLVAKKPFVFLGFKKISKPISVVLILILMVVMAPVLSYIIELNSNLVFPDFMRDFELSLRHSQEQALATQKVFLTFDGIGSMLYMLLIMAVIPAVGEELLFRGALQQIFIKWTKKTHLSIWITAILFSALHMQVYNFVAIALMGGLLGYLFYWSKSLWLPILAHFINNASVVLLTYFIPEFMEDSDVSIFAESEYNYAYYLISLALTLGVIFLIRKLYRQKNGNNQELLNEL